jgi:hypothetical protein
MVGKAISDTIISSCNYKPMIGLMNCGIKLPDNLLAREELNMPCHATLSCETLGFENYQKIREQRRFVSSIQIVRCALTCGVAASSRNRRATARRRGELSKFGVIAAVPVL